MAKHHLRVVAAIVTKLKLAKILRKMLVASVLATAKRGMLDQTAD